MSICESAAVEWNCLTFEFLNMRSTIQELLELEGSPEGTKGPSGLTAGELVGLLDAQNKAAAVAATAARRVCYECHREAPSGGQVVAFPHR